MSEIMTFEESTLALWEDYVLEAFHLWMMALLSSATPGAELFPDCLTRTMRFCLSFLWSLHRFLLLGTGPGFPFFARGAHNP